MSENDEKLTKNHWLSLGGAMAGWTLDAMDWMMLALALPLIRATFDVSLTQVGLLATATLAGACIGGIIIGIISDYMGRVKVLMFTMIWYGLFTGMCGLAQSYEQLLALRFIVGIGLGGEWGVGAALVSEYWPDKYRGRATSLVHSGWPIGYGLASLAYMYVVPIYGWRSLFFLGIIPAFVAILIRLTVPEPEAWVKSKEKVQTAETTQRFPLATLFSGNLSRTTILAMILATGALMAYWGSATWLPSFLATTRKLDILKTGGFLLLLNAGAFLGYQFFGWLADTKGRRTAFMSGMIGSIIITVIYVMINDNTALLFVGPVFGFITYGFFGNFGAFVSELFPIEARATGVSLVFNFGRGMSMLSPYLIGAAATAYGLAFGLGLTAVFNIIGVIAVYFLPETIKAGIKYVKNNSSQA